MSRPGASEPKNRATNSLRSGLVSQVAGGLLFRFLVRLVDESASGPPVGHTSRAAGVVAATRAPRSFGTRIGAVNLPPRNTNSAWRSTMGLRLVSLTLRPLSQPRVRSRSGSPLTP
jgi:hypothetical protein